MRTRNLAIALLLGGACVAGPRAQPAEAFNPLKPVCTIGGLVSGIVGKTCTAVQNGVAAGKKLASGHVGSALKTLVGDTGSSVGSKATFALGLAAVVSWVVGGAKYALHATAEVIGHTTAPQLQSTWFSATYWRVAGIATLLTLPFLFAAAIQALVHSDMTLLVRSAFGYLPLAMLGVGIAAPLTMLLLAASDQLSAVVSSAAGHASAHFLDRASAGIGALTIAARSPFLVFFAGLLTVGAAIALWFELLIRAAAVYVIVLMLPLAFAALVWPARRIWAIRAVEVLVALILSKFLIVAVLSLGGAALSQSFLTSVSGMLAGFVLLVLGAFSPWALLRLLPLGELASGAAGSLRAEGSTARAESLGSAHAGGAGGHEWATTTADMRREAEDFSDGELADPPPDFPPGKPDKPAPLDGQAAVPTPGTQHVEGADRDEFRPAAVHGASTDNGGPASPSAQGGPADADGGPARSDGGSAERSPGLGPIWQTEDFSWPVLRLGLESGWPPQPIEERMGSEPPSGSPRGEGAPPGGTETASADPIGAASPHEDHDPRPSPQPPEEGAL